MTSRDFCYWLQGYFEINASAATYPELSTEQVDCIRKHLALVFVHEIDPSAGPPEHQAVLNAVHSPKHPADASKPSPRPPYFNPGEGIRC
jgi:hypothetical protein